MKKTSFALYTLVLLTSPAMGQKKVSYWDDKPGTYNVPAEYAAESAVIMEENVRVNYKEDANKDLYMHITVHRIARILDDKGIESFNKLSLPLYNGQTMEEIKARTILADGKVIDVAKDKMKETKGEDGQVSVSFAMDGVEKNSTVEFLITYKKPAVYFGRETMQYSVPVMHASLEIQSPERIEFEEKGYNGFPTVKDTLIDKIRYIYADQHNVPALHNENSSFYNLYAICAEYKVSYLPEEKGPIRVFTWPGMAQRLYNNIYETTDKENKAVEKYLQSIGVAQADNEESKIKKIESAIKNGITIYKDINDEDAWRLDNIIAKKAATEGSIVRLMTVCMQKAGVKHEIGMSTDREEKLFDDDFENWNSIDKYVLYFPNQKKFLSPSSIYYRYPFTATDVITNKGIFCKLTTIGDVTSALADIRTIPARPVAESQNNIKASISFNADMEANEEISYSFTGYSAMGMREYSVLLPKDKIKELVQTLAGVTDRPEDLLKYSVSGEAFENYSEDKPLLIAATLKAPQLVEKAGEKYIFKVGDVIGKQSELYQSTERKLPVDLPYPHSLYRTITVSIPDGYKILNPETIKIHEDYKDEKGVVTTAFYSDYKINGNKLEINISEFYSQLHFPVSGYESFRKVINASADFNKVTLLLAKQ